MLTAVFLFAGFGFGFDSTDALGAAGLAFALDLAFVLGLAVDLAFTLGSAAVWATADCALAEDFGFF